MSQAHSFDLTVSQKANEIAASFINRLDSESSQRLTNYKRHEDERQFLIDSNQLALQQCDRLRYELSCQQQLVQSLRSCVAYEKEQTSSQLRQLGQHYDKTISSLHQRQRSLNEEVASKIQQIEAAERAHDYLAKKNTELSSALSDSQQQVLSLDAQLTAMRVEMTRFMALAQSRRNKIASHVLCQNSLKQRLSDQTHDFFQLASDYRTVCDENQALKLQLSLTAPRLIVEAEIQDLS